MTQCEVRWCIRTEPHNEAGEVHDGGNHVADGVPVRLLQSRTAAQPRIYVASLPVELVDVPALIDLLTRVGRPALAVLVEAAVSEAQS
jgi:hypothetical protein